MQELEVAAAMAWERITRKDPRSLLMSLGERFQAGNYRKGFYQNIKYEDVV